MCDPSKRGWPLLFVASLVTLCFTRTAVGQVEKGQVEKGHVDGGHVDGGQVDGGRASQDASELTPEPTGFPDYMTGDECLFCHREIGQTWGENRHQLTVRRADPDDRSIAKLAGGDQTRRAANQVEFLMGANRRTRFLKRSPDYGMLELLSTSVVANGAGGDRPSLKLVDTDQPHWDKVEFGDQCAGCHSTAVDTSTKAFSALSLDCFTCHGDVPLRHSDDVSLALLSQSNRDSKTVISICGQCHLRGGESRSSGLPYPNMFVPGNDLFGDFLVDLSDRAIASLPAIDRHVYENARDVSRMGKTEVNCLACHDVHGQHTTRHTELPETSLCHSCHVPGRPMSELHNSFGASQRRIKSNATCRY